MDCKQCKTSGQSNLTRGRIVAAYGRYSLYFTMSRPFPLKITSSHGDLDPPSNTWFLWLIQIHNPKGISVDSAVFVRIKIVTDRQTDRQTDRETLLRP